MTDLVKTLGVCCIAALAGAYGLALAFAAPPPAIAQTFLILSAALIFLSAALIFTGYVLWLAVGAREPEPFRRVMRDCARFSDPAYLVDKLGPLVLAFLFLGAFGTYKSLITRIQPFYFDGFLSDLDRHLLGNDAWRLTHSVIGAQGTTALEMAYRLWFAELSFSLIGFSIFAGEQLRRRFFLAFFLLWALLGFVAATALSSAGPCFLGLIHHPYADRYAGLAASLQSAPVALSAQHFLAVEWEDQKAGAFLGISAMPSLHVAFAALVALACWNVRRSLGIAAWAFWFVILVGSVHLGYHYFTDGIVGTAGAALIWLGLKPRSLTFQTESRLVLSA